MALSVLIALLSVITAYAAYQSAAIDSTSTDNYFLAQSHLNDSNAFYLERGQDIIYDFTTFDSYIAHDILGNEELSEYYYDQLSEEFLESADREEGPFDDGYFDAIYEDAHATLGERDEAFAKATHDSNRAVAYQLTVLIMAVGLSFAAWASLSEANKQVRFIFTFLSTAALIIGLGQMVIIPGPL
jgi:hypothetical protein